jgi:hypothetical protein
MVFTNGSSRVSSTSRVGRSRRLTVAAVAAVVVSLGAAGCGGTVSQVVSDIATQPACDAITDVQNQLTGIDVETVAPEQLDALVATITQAGTVIGAVGDQLGAGTSEQLDQAEERLDTAVADTQAGVEERRASVQSALDGYAAQLDTVKEQLGC